MGHIVSPSGQTSYLFGGTSVDFNRNTDGLNDDDDIASSQAMVDSAVS
jgi:hypothetical protein